MTAPVIIGDCLQVMRTLDANSVDAIVTDPPYGLGFMGKGWDHAVPGEAFWREALRVAKPGAHLAAFGGTRKYHRLAVAIEDAGWELRDSILRGHNREDCEWLAGWIYGSGFPKSHNGEWGGTALKPAWEPIVLARKPLIGTVEANWREHGTGALNIDGCRIGSDIRTYSGMSGAGSGAGILRDDNWVPKEISVTVAGRWPANLIHDGSEEVLAHFPQSSVTGARSDGSRAAVVGGTAWLADNHQSTEYTDTGSAARFFYCAKADRADRNDGCDGLPESVVSVWGGDEDDLTAGKKSTMPRANNHPTVKPTDLMRWLCRLVTPPGGLILDPFAGSGSTGRGAILEGFRFTGIELDPDYARIAEARIAAAVEQRRIDTAQRSLFGEAA